MENGIDLNEIPGEKAAKGERIQSNFPKKNPYSPRGNNDFVDVEPILVPKRYNVQLYVNNMRRDFQNIGSEKVVHDYSSNKNNNDVGVSVGLVDGCELGFSVFSNVL